MTRTHWDLQLVPNNQQCRLHGIFWFSSVDSTLEPFPSELLNDSHLTLFISWFLVARGSLTQWRRGKMGDFGKDDVLVCSIAVLWNVGRSDNALKASKYLHQQCISNKWLDPYTCSNPAALGVAIRRPNHDYIFEPASVDQNFIAAVGSLELPVAFSMSSNITETVLGQRSQYQTSVTIQARGISIPIVDSLSSIPARSSEIKHSLGCLVRKEGIVLLWADTVERAISKGTDVEQMLMEAVR